MTWSEIVCHPLLRNLLFKVETNRYGQIVMTEKTNHQGRMQFVIGRDIDCCKRDGQIIFGCSASTSDGVKVADVAWASDEFIAEHGTVTPYQKAPEICVDVVSPRNTEEEIKHKTELYLAKGALEVWVVDDQKKVTVYSHTGKLKKSKLVPKFKL
jgi:Uma2 family endonuclease